MTTTEVATRDTQTISVKPYAYWAPEERFRYAMTLAGAHDLIPSGLFDKATAAPSPAKIFLVLETGAMLGLHPMAALQGIDVIEGKAAISPQLFTGLVRKAGHRLRIQESGSIGAGDFRVEVALIRADDPEFPITASWDMDDTVSAGLVDSYKQDPESGRWVIKARSRNGNPLNWEKYPKDMCQWRALGRLARRGGADITSGVGYFPEELEVAVDQDGVREDTIETELTLIDEINALGDKADMARLWSRMNPRNERTGAREAADVWTSRVQAVFDAHLMVCKIDTRAPKEGAPGHTGDGNVDGTSAEHPLGDDSPGAPETTGAPATENPVEVAKPAEIGTEPSETEEERFERISREEHAAYLAANPES